MRATVRSPGGLTTPMYFAAGIPSLSPNNLKLLDKTVDVLAEADALAHQAGSKLIVAFVPTKFRTYRRVLEIPQDSDLQEWSVNELPEVLRRMLARRVPEAGYLRLLKGHFRYSYSISQAFKTGLCKTECVENEAAIDLSLDLSGTHTEISDYIHEHTNTSQTYDHKERVWFEHFL